MLVIEIYMCTYLFIRNIDIKDISQLVFMLSKIQHILASLWSLSCPIQKVELRRDFCNGCKKDFNTVMLGPLKNFEILRVKYLKNKWLGLTNHFDISIVFKISVFEILKINCCCMISIPLRQEKPMSLKIYEVKTHFTFSIYIHSVIIFLL